MLFPSATDQEKLCRDNFQKFVWVLLWNAAVVICNDTSAGAGKPDFCSRWGRLALGDVNMNWLAVFIGPEENDIFSNLKQLRHNAHLPRRHI